MKSFLSNLPLTRRFTLTNFTPAARSHIISPSAQSAVHFSKDVPTFPPRPARSDPIMMALRASRSISDALKVIGIHAPHMEPEHVVQSLKTLSSFHKSSIDDSSKKKVINSEEFLILCRRLKKQLSTLEIYDIMDAFKTVTMFKVPHNSVITMKLLQMIKQDINILDMNQITFLSFLLRHYEGVRNPLIDALKIALPVVFEAQLKTKLDRNNVGSLTEALIYCTRNEMAVSRQSKDYIIDALCGLDQLDWVTMDPRKARSIALAVCDISVDAPAYETVFRDAIDLVTQHATSFNFVDLEVLMNAMLKFMKRSPYLAHIPYFEAVANAAVRNNFTLFECGIILRRLNHLAIVNLKLLDYIADKIMEDPEAFKEGKFGLVKTFVSGLSNANYKTDHWNLLKDLLPACRCMENVSTNEPWIPMALELASLDLYSDALLAKIFDDSYLEKYLAREYNKIDLLQLLRLYQTVSVLRPEYDGPMPSSHYLRDAKAFNGINIVDLPLRGALEMEFGRDSVLSRCKTDLGIYIDHVVAIQPSGDPVEFSGVANSDDFVHIDTINISPDCQRVAVLLLASVNYNSLQQQRGNSALNTRVLEAKNYAVVNISQDTWNATPDWERVPYLAQQIKIRSNYSAKENRSNQNETT